MTFDGETASFSFRFQDRANLMAVMQLFSDASENGGFYSVGSVLFRKKNIKPFDKEWRSMLRRFTITHFHMTDCNAKQGEFANKSDQECDDCARQSIEILLKYIERGSIFSLSLKDFDEIILPSKLMSNPFTLGAWALLFEMRNWCDTFDPIARISYIFESGDKYQSDANNFFNAVAEDKIRTQNYRYENHAFLPKLKSLPTQAADILAWHGAKHLNRKASGNTHLRGDFNAIITNAHITDNFHDRAWLQHLVKIAKKHAGELGPELAGIAFRYNSSNANQMKRRIRDLHSPKL